MESELSIDSAFNAHTFFVDLSPLMEANWTGIANVTLRLAITLYRRFPDRCFFFVDDKVVSPVAVLKAERSPGGMFGAIIGKGYYELGHISEYRSRSARTIAFFPNVKPCHNFFDVEIVVFHDLSALLMPELHQGWAADLHAKALSDDMKSSDLICCISQSTLNDAVIYLGLDPGKAVVSALGVETPKLEVEVVKDEMLVVILGTIEPRKNLGLIAELLLCRPDLAARLNFVFVGRQGWGPSFDQTFSELLRDPTWSSKIIFADYLNEMDKWTLLRAARFAVFPSLFEGFGLPALECMSVGCPVLVSRTSSLVEFELPPQMYFDPFSVDELAAAVDWIDQRDLVEKDRIAVELRKKAEGYTWEMFLSRTLSRLIETGLVKSV